MLNVVQQRVVIVVALSALLVAAHARTGHSAVARLLDVQKIWDDAPHNAFTDLVRFNDVFYLAFREGPLHGVPAAGQPGGDLRVLRSNDGVDWTSAALFEGGINRDLRDAKMAISPNGRLMLAGAYAPHTSPSERQSLIWFSEDGSVWSESTEIGDPNYWLWGIQTHDDSIFSIGYGPTTSSASSWTTRLYRSDDGANFQTHVPTLTSESGSSEAALLFRSDDSAVALIRRDAGSLNALLGTSSGDFTQWTWQDTGVRFGGPEMIELPSGQIIAGGRRYDGGQRTSLNYVDPATGALTEFLVLPSGGDTSYPGMVWHDDRLWVSYYSSHEGKSNIYMAQVDFVNALPIRHNGDTNPIDEAWTIQPGGAPIAFNGPVNDNGTPAWNIYDDSSASGAREAWTRLLTPEQLATAETEGWRIKGRVRVLDSSDTLDGAVELSVFLNSDKGYVLWLGSDAAGNAVAGEFGGGSSSAAALGRTVTISGSGYHDYEMVFDPLTETVDVFADGALIIDDMVTRELGGGNVLNRVLWGANASAGVGNANYSFVDFRIGPELPGDYNGDGAVDAADYTEWQKTFGSTTNPAADGNHDGVVNAVDYVVWRKALASGNGAAVDAQLVPEPNSVNLVLAAVFVLAAPSARPATALICEVLPCM